MPDVASSSFETPPFDTPSPDIPAQTTPDNATVSAPVSESAQPPFLLELRAENLQPSGLFTPQAAVLITPALRQSGLLRALSPDDFKLLILVLSAVTDNGSFAATPELLASAIGLASTRLRERLHRLAERTWQGERLLVHYQTESGLHLFTPASSLFTVQRRLVFPNTERPGVPLAYPASLERHHATSPVPQGGFREAVIAYSRARYNRPRAEVEAEINRFLGWEPPQPKEAEEIPTTPEEETRLHLKRQLLALGIAQEEALLLLDTYPPARIGNQLEWLPHRHARNPAGFLLAAIEGDYDPPLAVRLQQLKSQDLSQADSNPEPNISEQSSTTPNTPEQNSATPTSTTPSAVEPTSVLESVVTPLGAQEIKPDTQTPLLNGAITGASLGEGEEGTLSLELPPVANSGKDEADVPVSDDPRFDNSR